MKSINQFNQKLFTWRVFISSCLYVALLGLAACDQDSSSGMAQKKIDRASENTEQRIDNSKAIADQKIDVLKETVDQNAERSKEQIDRSTEASKEALERSEEKVDQNAEQAQERVEQIEENAEQKVDAIKDSAPDMSAVSPADDALITAGVEAAILGSPLPGASQIGVTTNQGIVQLSGTVDSEQTIAKAVEIAKSQANVKDVQSNLVVNVIAPSPK